MVRIGIFQKNTASSITIALPSTAGLELHFCDRLIHLQSSMINTENDIIKTATPVLLLLEDMMVYRARNIRLMQEMEQVSSPEGNHEAGRHRHVLQTR